MKNRFAKFFNFFGSLTRCDFSLRALSLRGFPLRVFSLRGFTLIETLVAISILLIGVSAAFSAAQSGLSSTNAIKDRLTAIFLAQEAMEMARNIKDQNLLAQNVSGINTDPDWLSGLVGDDGCPGIDDIEEEGCDFNFIAGGAVDFERVTDPLNVNTSTGFYSYEQGAGIVQSKFTRRVAVEELLDGQQKEARVTVTVTWPNGSFEITDSFYNWFAP